MATRFVLFSGREPLPVSVPWCNDGSRQSRYGFSSAALSSLRVAGDCVVELEAAASDPVVVIPHKVDWRVAHIRWSSSPIPGEHEH